MAELLLLGTGASLADGSREPTMLAVCGATTTVLIDCDANPVRQLQRLSVPLDSIDRLILTRTHPDHTSGFPLLSAKTWTGFSFNPASGIDRLIAIARATRSHAWPVAS